MLVSNILDFKKEQTQKKAWQPSPLVQSYAGAHYHEYRQDIYQYQQNYRIFNDRSPADYFALAEEDAFKYVKTPVDKNDWRNFIRSGEERNKLDSLLAFLMDLNFKVEPVARDWLGTTNEAMGEVAESYLKFLNVLDDSETKDAWTDFSMFVYGTVFKQVKFDVRKTLDKVIGEWNPKDGIENYDPKLREIDSTAFVLSEVLKPNRVFLADVTKLRITDQDHIWYESVLPYAKAYEIFHDWAQWKYVMPYNNTTDSWTDTDTDVETETKESNQIVRVKWRESEVTNELSIYCNRVLMTPPGLKLPEGRYSCIYQQASVLHPHMAYGRSFMDNVRPFVAVKDVLTSILVDKSRQILEPPMKSRFRTMVNRYMFKPANVTPMQGDGDLTPLIPESAMHNFVFEAIKVYEQMADKASISPVFQGQASKGQMTKYEVEQQLIQSVRAVAGMVGSAVAWRKQEAELKLLIGLNHLEEITNHKFEIEGKLGELSRSVEFKNIPDTKLERLEATRDLVKAENYYRKLGQRKKFYIVSPKDIKDYSFSLNFRVNPQQRDSKSADEQAMKERISLYRASPGINQRAVDRKLIQMLNDDEEEFLQSAPTEQSQGTSGVQSMPQQQFRGAPNQSTRQEEPMPQFAQTV